MRMETCRPGNTTINKSGWVIHDKDPPACRSTKPLRIRSPRGGNAMARPFARTKVTYSLSLWAPFLRARSARRIGLSGCDPRTLNNIELCHLPST